MKRKKVRGGGGGGGQGRCEWRSEAFVKIQKKKICIFFFFLGGGGGVDVNGSVGNRKGKSLSIIGKLLPIDYRLIIENPSIA